MRLSGLLVILWLCFAVYAQDQCQRLKEKLALEQKAEHKINVLNDLETCFLESKEYNQFFFHLQQSVNILNQLDRKQDALIKLINAPTEPLHLIDEGQQLTYWTRLGWLYTELGQTYQSLEPYHKAIELTDNPSYLAHYIYTPLANNYNRLGDYANALEYQRYSLHIADSLRDYELKAMTLGNMSYTYENNGLFDNIIELVDSSIYCYQQVDDLTEIASMQLRKSDLLLKLEKFSDARTAFAIYLNNKTSSNILFDEYFLHSQLTSSSFEREKLLLMAIASGAKDSRISNRDQGKAYMNLGELYIMQHRYADAIQVFSDFTSLILPKYNPAKGSPRPNELINEPYLMLTFANWAKCINKTKEENYDEAMVFVDLAVHLSEKLLHIYYAQASQLNLGNETRKTLELGVSLCYNAYLKTQNQKYLFKALNYSEMARTSVLRHALVQRKLLQNSSDAVSLRNRYSDLNLRIQLLESQLAQQKNTSNETRAKLLELQQERKAFINTHVSQAYTSNSELFTWKLDPSIIQTVFERNNGPILELFLADSSLYTFLLTKHGINFNRYPFSEASRTSVSQWIKSLQNPKVSPEEYNIASYGAFKAVFEEIYSSLTTDHITIVNDGLLWNVPFQALCTARGNYSRFSELPYVLNSLSVNYAYSIGLLNFHRNTNTGSNRYVGFAPLFKQSTDLDFLNQTDVFISDIAEQWKGNPYIGLYANKASFVAESKRPSGILHLCTHASGNNQNYLQSWVAFNSEQGVEKLYLNELLSLELQNNLTILQGCETGLGPYYGGEGITSLSWAFTLAGSPTVVQTLWVTNNSSTSEVVESFLNLLNNQVSSSEALSKAKLSYVTNESREDWLKHPYYWAGINITGKTLYYKHSFSRSLSVILGLLVVAAIGGIYWYSKASRPFANN